MARIAPQLAGAFCLLASLSGCQYPYYTEFPPPQPLVETEIIRLSKEGTAAEIIIQKIKDSRTIYILDAKDVVRLHENGVSDPVIDFMLQTQKWDIERRAYHRYHPYYDPFWYPYPAHPHVGIGWYCW